MNLNLIATVSLTMHAFIISETEMYSHYGRFTITNHQYNDNLIKEASAQYQELSAEVNKQVCFNVL